MENLDINRIGIITREDDIIKKYKWEKGDIVYIDYEEKLEDENGKILHHGIVVNIERENKGRILRASYTKITELLADPVFKDVFTRFYAVEGRLNDILKEVYKEYTSIKNNKPVNNDTKLVKTSDNNSKIIKHIKKKKEVTKKVGFGALQCATYIINGKKY